MFKIWLGLLFVTFGMLSANAQGVIPLWDGQPAPFSKESDLQEYQADCGGYLCLYNIVEPTLTIYKAEGVNSGKAVIVVPGGGYEVEAIFHEGYDIAKALAADGITAAVLKYRLPNPASSATPELVPITDLKRALVLMRKYATKYGIVDGNVGVMGFSAGSHLATVSGIRPTDHPEEKPSFSALIYGTTRLDAVNKKWLEDTLYHRKLTTQEEKSNTLLSLVTDQTPAAFLVHAFDDTICHYSESTEYAQRLKENDVPVEMHLFPTGGHGFGLGQSADGTDQWMSLAINWIKRQ